MPLLLPESLPCIPVLKSEGFDVSDTASSSLPAEVHPLRLLLLNLMPQKEEAEMEYYRMLSHHDLWVEITLVKMSGLTYKTTPQAYVDTYYKDIADIMAGGECYDGLIITGAPVEQMPFEDVRYWKQLLDIYSWMQVHVNAILHICWGAQAALYGLFGIPKYDLREKMFGIFEQKIEISSLPIFKGFSNTFFMPHSRHTEIRRSDISSCKELEIVASSPVAGVSVVQTKDWRQLFVTGHLEYMPGRLAFEYRRDLKKHLPIHIPYNYFENDDPNGAIIDSWRNDARRFYKNWLENYVNNHSLSHVKP